jgi:hypothetical protein
MRAAGAIVKTGSGSASELEERIMGDLGRTLIIFGLLLVIVGVVISFAGKIPWLGNLPGDIVVRRERFTFYFPIVTCLVISAIISLVVYFFRR